jgi:hypothetical protein
VLGQYVYTCKYTRAARLRAALAGAAACPRGSATALRERCVQVGAGEKHVAFCLVHAPAAAAAPGGDTATRMTTSLSGEEAAAAATAPRTRNRDLICTFLHACMAENRIVLR